MTIDNTPDRVTAGAKRRARHSRRFRFSKTVSEVAYIRQDP